MENRSATPNFVVHLASSTHEGTFLEKALAFDLDMKTGKAEAPTWVQIFPAGPELAARDGRTWKMTDPDAFVAAQKCSKAQPILVDFDHLSSFTPEEGGDQTAAGWIEELEVRDGQVWARVAWTVRAAAQIADREWRFVSPEFLAHKTTKEVAVLRALSLVNRPAFDMVALAHEQLKKTGDTPMLKSIAAALGLKDDATVEEVIAAIQEKDQELETARASSVPSLDQYVPRADYDLALARADGAEAKLTENADKARKDEATTLIEKCVTEGKIAPASKDHYLNIATRDQAGFDMVKELAGTLPKLTDTPDLDDSKPNAHGLTDLERETAASLGLTEEQFAAQKATDNAAR